MRLVKTVMIFNCIAVEISDEDWSFMCKNRFFTDEPTEDMIQSEFVTGTGITRNRQELWEQATSRFSEYVQELKEILELDVNEMA